jgi:hypothetical protein
MGKWWFAVVLAACDGEEPYCETAAPIGPYNAASCDAFWVCCEGDPAEGSQCWFQSFHPNLDGDGLVWRCSGSLATCDGAQQEASSWACGGG